MDYSRKEQFSYLDGVPVKIGPRFLPPNDVAIPVAFGYEMPSDLFSFQYDFSLEEKVIESERKRKLEKEDAKNAEVASAIENFSKVSTTEGENVITASSSSVYPSLSSNNSSSTVWPSSSILQPKPKGENERCSNSQSSAGSTSKTINLSDFENDSSSPFDYMELQTINDIEELSTVFKDFNKETSEDEKVPSDNNASYIPSEPEVTISSAGAVFSRSVTFPFNDDYVDTSRTDCDLRKRSLLSNYPNFSLPPTGLLSKNVDNHLSHSNPSVSGLVNNISAFPGVDMKSDSSRIIYDNTNTTYTALSQVPFVSSQIEQKRRSSETEPHWFPPVKTSNSLRGSRSVSDLRNLAPSKQNLLAEPERAHTPPANTLNAPAAYQTSPLEKNVLKQTHNVRKEDILSSNGFLTSKVQHRSEHITVHPDPYDELNDAEQRFVNSVIDMGFARDQVSRTVKHLGADEKKVIEHLCQIQSLEEAGYDRFEAEAALHLHDYNKDEAIRYLDLLIQLQDFGFEKDAIKKALVQNKNNRDKVIEALLPS